jgi:hypothetical protein
MSKPGKSLKGLCKKLGVRLTVKRGKKRVYKSVAVLKRQCANKKKKKKVKRRKRRFGMKRVMEEHNVPDRAVYLISQFLGPTERMEHHTLQRELTNERLKRLGIEEGRIWKVAPRHGQSMVEIDRWVEYDWAPGIIYVDYTFTQDGQKSSLELGRFLDNLVFVK